MIVVTGSVTARADSFDEVRKLSLEHVHRSRTEPGCISHAVHVDCENPLRLVFFEQWADRAALLAHFAVPASRDFVRSLQALAESATTIELYEATRLEKFVGAWLYCHAKFILQCNIRAPRYLCNHIARPR
jgi:quinol monooxygenase YgiN